MTRRNIRLTLEYEGTAFSGWQVQRDRRTVQGEVAVAISKVTGERPTVVGASRTDAGVHAEGQTANFRTTSRIPAKRFLHALNAHLPSDVKVRAVRDAPWEFHAQFDARAKTYRYTVLTSEAPSPLRRSTTLHLRGPLDLAAMRRAARHLVGRKDFRAFGRETGRKRTTIRTLFEVGIKSRRDCIIFDVSGDGFLYTMVRSIVGTLLRVGRGKLTPDALRDILERGDRGAAGPVVGPEGLTLVKVRYSPWKRRSSTSSRA